MTTNKAREIIRRYEAAQAAMQAIDEMYEQNPEDAEIEARWDAAYRTEYENMQEVAAMLVNITGGKIDTKTARKMAIGKLDELKALLNKAG